jgi:hypothetical protein
MFIPDPGSLIRIFSIRISDLDKINGFTKYAISLPTRALGKYLRGWIG